MTQEEKARAYDELLDKAKQIYNKENDVLIKHIIEGLFPELKESEDERIRKIITLCLEECVHSDIIRDYEKDNAIAWLEKQRKKDEEILVLKDQIESLHAAIKAIKNVHKIELEKQGEKQQKVSTWKHWKDGVAGNGEGEQIYLIKCGYTYSLSSCLGFECDYIELSELDKLLSEKQGEQKIPIEKLPSEMKSIGENLGFQLEKIVTDIIKWFQTPLCLMMKGGQKPTDKIEPKFKVGDKIQYLKGCGTIMTIEKIENDEYIFANNLGHTTIEDGNKWYLVERNPTWSEEDEKIALSIEQVMNCASLLNIVLDKVDKIRTWLKSLKDKVQPQPKQEWSEEDQEKLIEAINIVDGVKYTEMKKEPQNRIASIDYYQTIIDWLESLRLQPKQKPVEWSEKDEKILKELITQLEALKCSFALDFKVAIKWLKSLRPQNTWKPSDEQIGVIEAVINNRSFQKRHLDSLYEQLKKLKGE